MYQILKIGLIPLLTNDFVRYAVSGKEIGDSGSITDDSIQDIHAIRTARDGDSPVEELSGLHSR